MICINNENPCTNLFNCTSPLKSDTNDVPSDSPTLLNHQQVVEDDSDLVSHASSDSYSFETANDANDSEMDDNDTEMLTATSFGDQQKTVEDEANLETKDGNDVLDPLGTLV